MNDAYVTSTATTSGGDDDGALFVHQARVDKSVFAKRHNVCRRAGSLPLIWLYDCSISLVTR